MATRSVPVAQRVTRLFRSDIRMTTLFVALTVGAVACGTDRPTAPVMSEIEPAHALIASAAAIATNTTAYMGDSVVLLKGASVELVSRTLSLSRVRTASWTSSSPSAVSVTSTQRGGMATGVNQGVSTVTLRAGTLTETAKVWSLNTTDVSTVSFSALADTLPILQDVKVRARAVSTAYGALTTSVATFTSSDTTVAVFDGSYLWGKKPGRVTVTVNALGKSSSKVVTMRGGAVSGTISSISALLVGGAASPRATFVDAANTPVSCTTYQWTSSAPSLMSIANAATATPTVTAIAVGTPTLSVRCDNGPTATFAVAITVPVQPGPPAAMLDLRFARLDSSVASPTVFVSAGVPLAKGQLKAVDIDKMRILVNGVEVARHASALLGTHSDGSLRSVLVQLTVPVASLNQPVTMEFGNRTLAPLAKTTPTGQPAAIISYISLDELIATGIVGKTKTRANIPTTATFWGKYESDWTTWEATHYAAKQAAYIDQYYDRIQAYFGFWARTGNALYFARGAELTRRVRDQYIVPAGYNIPNWQAFVDGMALHYWLTGDDSTRNTLLRTASMLEFSQGLTNYMLNDPGAWMDNRVMGRSLGLKVVALQMGATSLPAIGSAPAVADLRASAAIDLNDILFTQKLDGSWRFTSQCGQSSNFMTGLLTGILGEYYDDVTPDPRIIPAVTNAWTFLKTQWMPTNRAFKYYSASCPGHGDATPAGDLNGLFLDGLGWLYSKTGDQSLRTLGDEVYRGGVENAYLSGYKQFNQQYMSSWRWLGYR